MNYVFNKIKFNRQVVSCLAAQGKKKYTIINHNKNYKKVVVRNYSQSSSNPDPDPNRGPDPWKTLCFLGIWGLYHQYLNKKDIKRF